VTEDFMAGYREGIDYPGRPDVGQQEGKDRFWVTKAKRFKPYVHSVSRNACLIHKVADVDVVWYSGHYSYMRRLEQPRVIAHTVCGRSIFLSNGKRSGKMCEVPDPNAVLCGVCHGELPTFSKRRKTAIKRQWAKDHLGCKGVNEVIGPYQPPEPPKEMKR
jgi:hypothetical protein